MAVLETYCMTIFVFIFTLKLCRVTLVALDWDMTLCLRLCYFPWIL